MDGPETIVISDDDDLEAERIYQPERGRASAATTISVAKSRKEQSIDDMFPEFNWHILQSNERETLSTRFTQVNEHENFFHDSPRCTTKEREPERQSSAKNKTKVEVPVCCDAREFRPNFDRSNLSNSHQHCEIQSTAQTNDSVLQDLAAVSDIKISNRAPNTVPVRPQKELRVSLPCSVQSDGSVRAKPTKAITTLATGEEIIDSSPTSSLESLPQSSNMLQSGSNFTSLMVTAEKWLRGRMASITSEALANAKQSLNADATKIQSLSHHIAALREQISSLEAQLLSQTCTFRMENAALQRRAEAAERSLAALTNLSKQSVGTQTQIEHISRNVETQTSISQLDDYVRVMFDRIYQQKQEFSTEEALSTARQQSKTSQQVESLNSYIKQPDSTDKNVSAEKYLASPSKRRASPSQSSMVPSRRSRKEGRVGDRSACEDCVSTTKQMKEASLTSVSPSYSNSSSSPSSAYSVLSPSSIELFTSERVGPTSLTFKPSTAQREQHTTDSTSPCAGQFQTDLASPSSSFKQSCKLAKRSSNRPVSTSSLTSNKNDSVCAVTVQALKISRRPNEHGVSASSIRPTKAVQFKMERLNYGVLCKYDGPKHPLLGVRSSLPAPSFARLDFEHGTCRLTYDFEYDERALKTYGVKNFVISVADSVEMRWYKLTISASSAFKTVRTAQAGHVVVRLFGGFVDISERLRDSEVVLYFYVQALDRNAQLGRLSMPFGARMYPR